MIKNPARTLIYLASRSPRRRELLKQIGVSFEVLVLRENPARGPDVDESHLPGELPDDYVRRVCRANASPNDCRRRHDPESKREHRQSGGAASGVHRRGDQQPGPVGARGQ